MTITHSDTITKLMGAMLQVQGQVDGVAKTSVNPHFKNRYASLESVVDTLRGPCQEAGLVVIQAPGECIEGTIAITTMIAHAESGEWLRSTVQLPLPKNDPQGAGSAITYGTRYSLMSMFVLPPVEDDDGNTASQRPVQRQEPRPASSQPPRQEARPEAADESPEVIKARMLAAVGRVTSVDALESLTTGQRWAASFPLLPEASRKTIMAAITKRHDDLARVPA